MNWTLLLGSPGSREKAHAVQLSAFSLLFASVVAFQRKLDAARVPGHSSHEERVFLIWIQLVL